MWIFSSDEVADGFSPLGVSEAFPDYRQDVRALYWVDDGKPSLTVMPIGISAASLKTTPRGETLGQGVYDTEIALPTTRTPLSTGDAGSVPVGN